MNRVPNLLYHQFKSLAFVFILLFTVDHVTVAQIRVNSSSQLASVLQSNKELGTIILDCDVFEVSNLEVNAGGRIIPASGRNPIIMGECFVADRNYGEEAEKDYWKVKIPTFKAGDFFAFDDNQKPLPISYFKIMNDDGTPLVDSDIVIVNQEQMTIKIPIPNQYSFMKNKSKTEMKNCIVKFCCWYRSLDLMNVYTNSKYLFGQLSDKNVFNSIHKYNYLHIAVDVFNYPGTELSKEGCVFIDGKDFIHIPNKTSIAKISTREILLKLTGQKDLFFDRIHFMGGKVAIDMNGAQNKHFNNCLFSYCTSGIVCNNGDKNILCNSSVANCTFNKLYSSLAVRFSGCDNVVIAHNTISHVGFLNKGWFGTIQVSGNGFIVEDNDISDFNYHGIFVDASDYIPCRKRTIGVIRNNIIDNKENYDHPENLACDGGGIYVYANANDLEISNNIIRNFGAKNSMLRGIFLDAGAGNCKVRNNLVYNIYPGEYAIFSSHVSRLPFSAKNNSFENNIVIGNWLIRVDPEDPSIVVRDNYYSGSISSNNIKALQVENNIEIKASALPDGELIIDRSTYIKRRSFCKEIRRAYNNKKRLLMLLH